MLDVEAGDECVAIYTRAVEVEEFSGSIAAVSLNSFDTGRFHISHNFAKVFH